ncbi:hypothetical protein, partial [Flammeovirga sp. OC4]|uniref:hypothetical protein n=1 Tax=Flammeovirga sp. OC4 TaxID=1382345 RepID=UPI0005C440DD
SNSSSNTGGKQTKSPDEVVAQAKATRHITINADMKGTENLNVYQNGTDENGQNVIDDLADMFLRTLNNYTRSYG